MGERIAAIDIGTNTLLLLVAERSDDGGLMMLGGKTSRGLGDTKKMLDSTRPVVAAQAVGIARAAYEFLLERVRTGERLYGKPPGGHQHIAFALADMFTFDIPGGLPVCQ